VTEEIGRHCRTQLAAARDRKHTLHTPADYTVVEHSASDD